MPDVVLLYSPSCPHVDAARSNLMRAFARADIAASWREIDLDAADLEPRWRGFGSPTVLVDGEDVADPSGGAARPACRSDSDGAGEPQGSPSIEAIAARLCPAAGRAWGDRAPANAGRSGRWRSTLTVLPGIGVALLPKVVCPACWPAYAGVLSALGLGFLLEGSYLLPLTAVFLAVAVFALAFRARRRRGYGPFIAGLSAATLVLVGKFAFDSDAAMYGGIAMLVAASLWNSWPSKRATQSTCQRCGAPETNTVNANARSAR